MPLARSIFVVSLLLAGCYESHASGERPVDPRRDGGDDGGSDAGCVTFVPDAGGTAPPERVDLLFLVDNSNSMGEEQVNLAQALPNLVRGVSSGDADLDGELDFPPVESLHLGVITPDMGTGGFPVPTCDRSDFGDDGVLRAEGASGCAPIAPPFLEFRPDAGVTVEEFAEEASCVTNAGTGGCGFEQPLEALLKAVTPASAPLSFFDGTRGHADGANAGFLRPDSVLAIVVVSDEDDCSARDPELFSIGAPAYTPDLNLRCVSHPEALYDPQRYVQGLLARRAAQPGRLVFASVVGVPPELAGEPEGTILADPRLQTRIDTSTVPPRPEASCDTTMGLAFPPRRLLQVSEGLRRAGARTAALSICEADLSPAVAVILDEIAEAAGPICRG